MTNEEILAEIDRLTKLLNDITQTFRRHKHLGQQLDQSESLGAVDDPVIPPTPTPTKTVSIIPFTRNMATLPTFDTYPHGLGRIPTHVVANGICNGGSGFTLSTYGHYDGTTEYCNWFSKGNNGQPQANAIQGFGSLIFQPNTSGFDYNIALITFDITNVYVTWARAGSPSGNAIALLAAY